MLALDYALGHGYSFFWFHLSTFLLFLGLIVLLFEWYRLLLDKTEASAANAWLALFAAAWFGLHPATAETVNYVIQRGDLYCTLGCVAALYLFARYPDRRKFGLYLLPFILAMLSKPPAAVFPLLLLLYVYFFESRDGAPVQRLRRAATASIPAVVVTAALLWLQSAMTPKSYTPTLLSAADYRLTQPYVWLRYTVALFLPLHLNVDTDLSPFSGLDLAAAGGVLFALLILAAIWFAARRRRLYPIAYGLLWFLLTQLPTSLYPLSEVENDHRMFFSFVGLVLAVVWTVWLLWEALVAEPTRTRLRPAMTCAAAVVLVAYGWGAHQRNRVWHSEESLWLDDVQKSPKNGRGLMNYALTQMGQGKYPVALDYLERAAEYTPNYPTLEINLGVVNGAMADLGDTARSAEAERHFLRAISLAPNADGPHAYYGRWLAQHQRSAEAIRELTTAVALNATPLFQRDWLIKAETDAGDLEAAKAAARQTLAIAPDDTTALAALEEQKAQGADYWIELSLKQYQQAQYTQAIGSARKALELNPNSAEAYNNIAASYGAMRRWPEALENVRRALQLNPNLQIAKNNLAWYLQQSGGGAAQTADDYLNDSLHLYQTGQYEDSVRAARTALTLRPNFAEAWNNIAAAEASLHRWDDAIAAAQKAIALKPDFQLAKNNLAWALSEKAKR
jgi:tetratricopeptide (TPR) repeat protein